MVQRIDLDVHRIRIVIDVASLICWLTGSAMAADDDAATSSHSGRSSRVSRAENANANAIRTTNEADLHVIDLPLSIRRRGVEQRLVIDGQAPSLRRPDRPLIETLARARAYLEALTDGQGLTRKDVATGSARIPKT